MAQRTTAERTPAPAADVYAGPTIAEMAECWERSLAANGRSAETIRTYTTAVAQFDAFAADQGMPREVAKVSREHVEAFIIHLLETRSQSTAKTRFGGLKTFWRYVCEDEGEVDRSPMERMKAPTVDEVDTPVPDPDALRKLLAVCKGKTFDDRRDAALIRLAADTGMRRGELAGLRLEDIDVRAKLVEVAARSSKSRRRRLVSFTDETANALARYERERRRHPKAASSGDAYWIGKLGPLGGAGILQMLHRRCEEAGVERMHPHQLRHFFADAMKAAGASDEVLMQLGGWRSHAMVARYGRAQAQRRANEAYRNMPGPTERLR